MPSYRRAVVLMKGFLGDAVMSTPLLEGLRANMVTKIVAPPAVGVLLGEEWQENFIPFDGKGLLARVMPMRAANADIAFVLNRSFRSALAAKVAGIKVRVGHSVDQRGFLLSHRVPFDTRRHESEGALDLARAVGIELPPISPVLRVSSAELERGRELLGDADLALQPGARHEYKRFRPETLWELIPLLRANGHRPVLIGGSDELEAAAAVLSRCPDVPSVVGKCTLRETLGLLALSRVAVGADTGIMHIAAAVGCPTVTVFGPTEFATRWGHLYAPHQVLQASSEGMVTISAGQIAEAVGMAISQAAGVVTRTMP